MEGRPIADVVPAMKTETTMKLLRGRVVLAALAAAAAWLVDARSSTGPQAFLGAAGDPAYASEFSNLSQNGNSNCSRAFRESIASMPDDSMLRGSCCGPMNMHVYSEQRRGLADNYSTFAEIPLDPYNIPASIAKRMMSHVGDVLTPEQQGAYDYAMSNSSNNGPCCCQCWRWQFYGGLAKYLVETYGFNGEQVTDVWDYSDGCGGEEDHVYHS